MIREALDQWDYVISAYAIAIPAIVGLLVYCWQRMRKAERLRDAARGGGKRKK